VLSGMCCTGCLECEMIGIAGMVANMDVWLHKECQCELGLGGLM